jgi:hypothetical protein
MPTHDQALHVSQQTLYSENEAIKGNVQTKEIVRELSKDDRQYFHFSIRYRKVSTIW